MKKLLSFVLVLTMILTLAISTFAAPKVPEPVVQEGARTAVMLDKNPFHCNATGGNGRAYSYAFENELAAAGKKGTVTLNLVYIGDNAWLLDSKQYVCNTCGNNEWASFSNKSGVPDGKNMQFTHPAKKEIPVPEVYGTLNIKKTVGGEDFAAWADNKGLSLAQMEEIGAGMKFTAYLLTGENGSRTTRSFNGEFIAISGTIQFGSDLPIGWYEVVEEISGTATNYFVGTSAPQVYYVGQTGVSSEITHWISGAEGVGTVVSHSGAGVNWTLPDVWDNQLRGQSAYNKLKSMGAQWVWNMENTYVLGIDGATYSETFKVTLGEAIDVPIYFAADNVALIYVNGKLAAFTNVALAGRGVSIGDDYDPNVLGTLRFDQFDGRWSEGWAHTYEAAITLEAGENEIIIIAANSSSTGYLDDNGNFVKGDTGTDNDGYNLTNNPCGVIFGFEIPAVTFDNIPKN